MKFSTSTVTERNQFVPWLAATGPLAYTPEQPPSRDYFFQYSWIIPEIFSPKINRREHYFFGDGPRDSPQEIFEFWSDARSGKAQKLFLKIGRATPDKVEAPIAVYRQPLWGSGKSGYMLIQHGSYQAIPEEGQPEIADGILYLYRGIQKATVFRYPRFDVNALAGPEQDTWRAYLKTQREVLSDSVTSFNSIHDRTMRSETSQIKDRGQMTDDIAVRNGLLFERDEFAALLWNTHHQCFAMQRWVADRKFGPNFVVFKTPLTNVRITTFFAREFEAKVIDPNKMQFVESVGCSWENAALTAT